MNERKIAKIKYTQKSQVIEACVAIIFIFSIIAFLFLYLRTDSQAIVSDKISLNNEEISGTKYDSKILQNHLDRLRKIEDSPDYENIKQKLDENLLKEIEGKLEITKTNNTPFKISAAVDKDSYAREFLRVLRIATSSKMGEEMIYFTSQLSGVNGEILELSPTDVEDIYRIASEYEIFAENIQKLNTPTEYKDIAEITTEKSKAVAFYLRKLMDEKDPYLYSHIFNKYIEANKYIFK